MKLKSKYEMMTRTPKVIFFIRVAINDLRIKDDAFYKRNNNDLKQ